MIMCLWENTSKCEWKRQVHHSCRSDQSQKQIQISVLAYQPLTHTHAKLHKHEEGLRLLWSRTDKFFEWQIILYHLLCLSKAFSTVKLVVFGFNCYLAKSENLLRALQNLNECTDVKRVFQIPHIFLDYILSSRQGFFPSLYP